MRSAPTLEQLNTIKMFYAQTENDEHRFFVCDKTADRKYSKSDLENSIDYAEGKTLIEAMHRFEQNLMKNNPNKAKMEGCFCGIQDSDEIYCIENFLKQKNDSGKFTRSIYLDLINGGFLATAEDSDCGQIEDFEYKPVIIDRTGEKNSLRMYKESKRIAEAIRGLNELILDTGLFKTYRF